MKPLVKNIASSSLFLAVFVAISGFLLNLAFPVSTTKTQAVFGGEDVSIPYHQDELTTPKTALLASGPIFDDIDYDEAENSLYKNTAIISADIKDAPSVRKNIITYQIKEGDTLSSIAKEFNITLTTMLNANPALRPTALSINQEILIPPLDGAIHIVKRGDTITSLAILYGVTPKVINNFNNLTPNSTITISQTIVIPGANPTALASSNLTNHFSQSLSAYIARAGAGAVYPLTTSARQVGSQHGRYGAYDLATSAGTTVIAANGGIVEYVNNTNSYDGGYGNRVIIRHDNNRQTLYAHLLTASVTAGQYVVSGEKIGTVGSTGKSTGPHLHFEIR